MKEEQPSCDLHRAFQKTSWCHPIKVEESFNLFSTPGFRQKGTAGDFRHSEIHVLD